MSRQPTPRQLSVLRFVEQFIRRNRKPPAEREIARHFGIHQSAVRKHLAALENKGLLTLGHNGSSRDIRISGEPESVAVALLGADSTSEALALDSRLAGEDSFLFRAPDSAMAGAGIIRGDLVLVRRSARVRNGEVAVVSLGGERRVVRYFDIAGRVILEQQPDGHPLRHTLEREEQVVVEGYALAILRTLGYSPVDMLAPLAAEEERPASPHGNPAVTLA